MLINIVAETQFVGLPIAKLSRNLLLATTSQTPPLLPSLSAVFRLVQNRSFRVPPKPTLQQIMKCNITRGYI